MKIALGWFKVNGFGDFKKCAFLHFASSDVTLANTFGWFSVLIFCSAN